MLFLCHGRAVSILGHCVEVDEDGPRACVAKHLVRDDGIASHTGFNSMVNVVALGDAARLAVSVQHIEFFFNFLV